MLTFNVYTSFQQYIGEKLLAISRKVIRNWQRKRFCFANLFFLFLKIKFLGTTGVIDFDEAGARRSIQLKILDLSENGMLEIGTWSDVHRLAMSQFGVQQIAAIRKHLQVVTREVIMAEYPTV